VNKRTWIVTLSLAALVGMATAASAKPTPKTCDANARANALAAIDAACPCAGQTDPTTGAVVAWKNHGQYMKCVAHARNAQAKGGVAKQCLKDVVPCAANSTCGKSAAVACITSTGTCLNDPVPGDGIAQGTCDWDTTKACDTDADCAHSMCQIADDAATCTGMGGTSAGGSCCE